MKTICFDWTDERVELLIKLWADGFSASQIAAELGTTRSSVIGKVHRLGLSGRHRSTAPRKESDVRIRRKQHRAKAPPPATTTITRMISNGRGYVMHESKQAAEAIDLPNEDIPIQQRRTLLELTNETCRWPIGDGANLFFCGAPDADLESHRPYCRAHHLLAYSGIPTARGVYIAPRKERV